MRKFNFLVSVILVFVINGINTSENVIGNTATQGNYTLTVNGGSPDVEPKDSIKKGDTVTFHFEISITKKDDTKITYIEEITPADYITKVTYVLKASSGRVNVPTNFVMSTRYPSQFTYEVTNGNLLSNVDVACEPLKGGKYTMQLTVTATTKDGKELKPDPVVLEVFIEDAVINGYYREGRVKSEEQDFDLTEGEDIQRRWPIGHIAWQINVDSSCTDRLKELATNYKQQAKDEVEGFIKEQETKKTELESRINVLKRQRQQLKGQLRILNGQLPPAPGRTPAERSLRAQLIPKIIEKERQIGQVNSQITPLESQKAEVERDINEADRRLNPEQNNGHKVGFDAASLKELKDTENKIVVDDRYLQLVDVMRSGNRTKKETRRVFDSLSVQGRLSDDNQGQKKNEQTTASFCTEKLTLENAVNGLEFISDHWGKKDKYGPACNCVDMANKGFHAVDITKVPDNHTNNPCYVELRVIYTGADKNRHKDGIIHLSLPEQYKKKMTERPRPIRQ
jgi:hypothetical protein